MSSVSGVIAAISSKPVNTKFGPKPTYTINVNDEWYKCGFTKPKANKGDDVSFLYTEGTYGKEIDMKSFEVVGGGTTAPAASVPKSASDGARPTFGGKGVFPIPPLDGQRAIVRQNSITNAVAMLKDVLGADKKMSNGDKAAEVIAMARMFEAYSCGDLDLAKAVSMKKAESVDANPFEEKEAA